MPAYNYYPVTYQNPYQQSFYQPTYTQPMMQQPVMQQQPVQAPQQAQPLQTMQSSIIWVSGDKEAAMYPIAPNNAVTLWSQSEPVVYLKQADASGKPTMKIYDLVERTQNASTGIKDTEDKSPAYATKDELAAVVGAVKGFDGLLSSLKSDIDTMKGDMYGIAGKKKPVKKQEAEDDA